MFQSNTSLAPQREAGHVKGSDRRGGEGGSRERGEREGGKKRRRHSGEGGSEKVAKEKVKEEEDGEAEGRLKSKQFFEYAQLMPRARQKLPCSGALVLGGTRGVELLTCVKESSRDGAMVVATEMAARRQGDGLRRRSRQKWPRRWRRMLR